MDCAFCRKKLEPYLDRELSSIDLLAVSLHLESCPSCAEQYEFSSRLQRLVKVSCRQDLIPPALRAKLDTLIASMQTQKFRDAMKTAFSATPTQLGAAAVTVAAKRKV